MDCTLSNADFIAFARKVAAVNQIDFDALPDAEKRALLRQIIVQIPKQSSAR